MKRASLFAAVGSLAVAIPAIAQNSYVPTGIWRDANQEAFFEDWFGGQLRAMGEPTLRNASDRGRFTRRLRLLILPTFSPAYALRVDESGSGGAVTFVELNGRGGYSPGSVAVRRHYRLSSSEMRDVNDVLRQYRLTAMPPLPPDSATENPQDAPICPDATQFVFELIDARGSHFVTRSTCDDSPDLYALLGELLSLRPDRRRDTR